MRQNEDFRPSDWLIRFGSTFEKSAQRSAMTREAAGRQPSISLWGGPLSVEALALLADLPHSQLFVTRVRRLPDWVVLRRTGRWPHATLYLPGSDLYYIQELAKRFRGPCPNPAIAARLTPPFAVGQN